MNQNNLWRYIGVALLATGVLGCADNRVQNKGHEMASEEPPPFDREMYEKIWMDDYPSSDPAEPKLARMDEAKAVQFLDRTSLNWAKKNACGTCHTNIPDLMARPLTAPGPERDSVLSKVREGIAST